MTPSDPRLAAVLDALEAFAARPLVQTNLALATAFLLALLIGFERQWRQRSAGLRTNVLVAVGAASFANLGFRLLGHQGALQLVAYVISGIGFLGAGVILKDGTNIRGLNTAATLWCSAAVGAFAGTELFGEAVSLTAFVLAGNTLLRPLVNFVNRRPMDQRVTEAQYRIHAICNPADVSAVRDLLADALEAAHYPVRDIEILSEGDNEMELAAVLVPTTADPAELDAITDALARAPEVASATWTVSATS